MDDEQRLAEWVEKHIREAPSLTEEQKAELKQLLDQEPSN
jgi:hypothetical protein